MHLFPVAVFDNLTGTSPSTILFSYVTHNYHTKYLFLYFTNIRNSIWLYDVNKVANFDDTVDLKLTVQTRLYLIKTPIGV